MIIGLELELEKELGANTSRKPLQPSQETIARKNANAELTQDNPYFRGMLDEDGYRAEGVSDADWAVFEQERDKIIQRQGGLTDTGGANFFSPSGSRTGNIGLPLQSQQSTPSMPPNMPPPIPLNPGNPNSNVSVFNDRESEIDNAIRERYPEASEEHLRDPDFRKQVAEFMGIN